MAKIMEAKQQSKSPVHFVGKTSQLACNTIMGTFCLVVSLAIPITMVVLGAIYMNSCPLERMIPNYLIVSGSLYIAKTLIDLGIREYTRRLKKEQGEDCEECEQSQSWPLRTFNFFSGSP